MQTKVFGRAVHLFMATLAVSSVLLCSGCGRSKAANAQTPPPAMLSEPVPEPAPAEIAAPYVPEAPEAPVSGDAYAAQKRGQSRELPVFKDPTLNRAPQEPIAVSVPVPPITDTGSGKYHVLAKGETIYAVSRKYNVKPKQILDANNFKDPSKLAVGTKVYIP